MVVPPPVGVGVGVSEDGGVAVNVSAAGGVGVAVSVMPDVGISMGVGVSIGVSVGFDVEVSIAVGVATGVSVMDGTFHPGGTLGWTTMAIAVGVPFSELGAAITVIKEPIASESALPGGKIINDEESRYSCCAPC